MEFTVGQIAEILGGDVIGDADIKIKTLSTLEKAAKGSITFLSNPKYENQIYSTRASAVIVAENFQPRDKVSASLIKVKDPYSSFTDLLEDYKKRVDYDKSGVENPSYAGKNLQTGKNIYRGAFSYIGDDVIIGNNVKIYPHVYVGDQVTIDDDVIIHAGARIYPRCKIGKRCVLHPGAVIGSDGFGFAPQPDGTYKTIPQLGNVILEDDVNVGANTVIDCATLDSTIIRKGVKLDNLIQIGHNVEIGENTVIAGQSGVSGSTKIGKNCLIGGQVGIAGHLNITDKVSMAAKSGVPRSIQKEGAVIFGSPALEKGDYFRSFTVFKKLPELDRRIKELEEKTINLPSDRGSDEH